MKNMQKTTALLVIFCCICLNACSNQQIYNSVQQNRLNECRNQPHTQDVEECEKRYSMEWKEYEQQRQALKNK